MIITRVDLKKFSKVLFEMDIAAYTRDFDYPPRDEKDQIDYLKDCEVYIASEGVIPVGFFAYRVNENDTEVYSVTVTPKYQGKGIGKAMMQKLFELVDGHTIRLVTHPKNTNAIIFYLKSGFTISGWKDNYYGDGEPRLLLYRSPRKSK